MSTTTNPTLAALQQLKQSMIRGGSAYESGEPDPEETLDLKAIKLNEGELLRFNGAPDCAPELVDYIEKSEMNNALLGIFQRIFCDVLSAQLEYSNRYNKWMFVINFRFMTDEQFKAAQDESTDELVRAVSSTFNPEEKTGGIAEMFISLTNQQNMSSSDISKYASITKEAKERLTEILFFDPRTNPKKKWIKGENYDIVHTVQTSYNGARFSNIIASVYLDAEKVMSVLCSTIDDRKTYKFTFEPSSTKINNQDCLFRIHRISVKHKRLLTSKYGIQFSTN